MIVEAISGAVTCGIGTAVGTIGQFGTKIAVQAVAHGAFQGIMSAGQGGKFWSGFAAGAVSSLASSLWTDGKLDKGGEWGGIGGKYAESLPGMMLFGTVSGGAAASLSGGNFWQGAVTGLIVSALNHGLHEAFKTKTKYSYRSYKTDEDGNVTSEKLVYFKSTGKDRLLYSQAVSEPLIDNTLSVYGHGNTHNFNYNSGVGEVDALLMNDSVMYRNFIMNGGNLIMNLKSCNTGNYSRGGFRTISEDLTQMRPGLIIHAPAAFWKYNGTIEGNAGYNMFINGAKVGWDLKR